MSPRFRRGFLPSLTALRPLFVRWEKWVPANCQIDCCCNILNALGKNLTATVEYDIDILGGTIISGILDDSVSSLFVRRRMSLSRGLTVMAPGVFRGTGEGAIQRTRPRRHFTARNQYRTRRQPFNDGSAADYRRSGSLQRQRDLRCE